MIIFVSCQGRNEITDLSSEDLLKKSVEVDSANSYLINEKNKNKDTICFEKIDCKDSDTDNSTSDIFILEPESYHEEEVDMDLKNYNWYGLYELSASKFAIKKTAIDIILVHDDIVDGEGEKTGRRVKAMSKEEPVFLIGGNITLTEKEISGKKYDYLILNPDDTLWLDSKRFIFARGCFTKYNDYNDVVEIFNYQLIVSDRTTRQVFANNMQFVGEGPHILWSGDIDNDGIVDFIFDKTSDYNLKFITLYLSGKATKNALYKLAAIRKSSGC